MATENNNPNIDQANKGSMAGMLREVLTAWLRGEVDDCLPAKVVSYDRAKNRACVQILVSVVGTGGEVIPRAQVQSVPVFTYSGGGFLINFPCKAGDHGWLKAADRDTSLHLQNGQAAKPNTKRLHSFEDGMFIPDMVQGYTIAGEDADSLVIQNTSGSVRVALSDTAINLAVGGSSVKVTEGHIDVVGQLTVTGGMAVSGAMTNGGVNVGNTHTHSGVQTGLENTGGPA